LAWIGLAWIGLGLAWAWIGLAWIGLDWLALPWMDCAAIVPSILRYYSHTSLGITTNRADQDTYTIAME